jgi:demethylmenaquinone methyltransferase/2-methoxy-6-polyprenyl-1,4-benzoquinol methylase
MLGRGREKIREAGLETRIHLSRGDAVHIPVRGEAVDAVTIGFGIRNVAEPAAALKEAHRVLRPGGRLAILEFGYPRPAVLKAIYLWYFKRVLPLVGRLVSKHDSAYRYLPASVGTFYEPGPFCDLVKDQGFVDVLAVPLTFGIVHLYRARKPAA